MDESNDDNYLLTDSDDDTYVPASPSLISTESELVHQDYSSSYYSEDYYIPSSNDSIPANNYDDVIDIRGEAHFTETESNTITESEITLNNDLPNESDNNLNNIENESELDEDTPEVDPSNSQQNLNLSTTATTVRSEDSEEIATTSNRRHAVVETDEADEPPAKCAKVELDKDISNGQTCPICFELWTSNGEHRLIALKCGHLFGKSCIKTWFVQRLNRYCPTCKTKSSNKDIRPIYATCVSFVDNSEVEAVKAELEETKEDKNKLNMKIEKLLAFHKIYENKIKILEDQLADTKNKPKNLFWTFKMLNNIEMVQNKECRVFAHHKYSNSLYVSQMNQNSFFYSYGIRRLDCQTYNLDITIPMHKKEIRSLSYSEHNDLLMSVSFDKYIKLLSSNKNKESISIETDLALWSCCWDREQHNRLYAGCANGTVLQYDLRQTKTCLNRFQSTTDRSPVIAVESTSKGLVSCQLNSLTVSERHGNEGIDLYIEGPFTDMNYDPITEHFIASSRPSVQSPYCKHTVFTLNRGVDSLICNKIHTFQGSLKQTCMLKFCQLCICGDHMFSMYNESEKAINIWSISKQIKLKTLPYNDLILDMCSWTYGDGTYLGTLTKNRVQIYKLTYDPNFTSSASCCYFTTYQ